MIHGWEARRGFPFAAAVRQISGSAPTLTAASATRGSAVLRARGTAQSPTCSALRCMCAGRNRRSPPPAGRGRRGPPIPGSRPTTGDSPPASRRERSIDTQASHPVGLNDRRSRAMPGRAGLRGPFPGGRRPWLPSGTHQGTPRRRSHNSPAPSGSDRRRARRTPRAAPRPGEVLQYEATRPGAPARIAAQQVDEGEDGLDGVHSVSTRGIGASARTPAHCGRAEGKCSTDSVPIVGAPCHCRTHG